MSVALTIALGAELFYGNPSPEQSQTLRLIRALIRIAATLQTLLINIPLSSTAFNPMPSLVALSEDRCSQTVVYITSTLSTKLNLDRCPAPRYRRRLWSETKTHAFLTKTIQGLNLVTTLSSTSRNYYATSTLSFAEGLAADNQESRSLTLSPPRQQVH